MPETETGTAAVGLIDQLAAALGVSPIVIEISIFAFLVVLLLVTIFAVLAIFRIRKEMISLNFKIVYIGRLIEQAVKGPATPKAAQAPPTEKKKSPAPPEPKESGDKFKL